MPRLRAQLRPYLIVGPLAALLAAGLFVGSVRSAEWDWRAPLLSDLAELTSLEPVRALPRTEAVLATLEAERLFSADRPYAAWQLLSAVLDVDGPAGQAANLMAARAAAEWGGWQEVREALAGRDWLAGVASGDGLLLLARAEEETGNLAASMATYRRYLQVEAASDRGVAHARLARLLDRHGRHVDAAAEYERAAAAAPEVADWLRVLNVEQLVAAGDPAATGVATGSSGGSAPARFRRVQLEAQGWITAAETGRAINRLEWEARILRAEGAVLEAAELELDRARLLLGSATPAEGREVLRSVAASSVYPAAPRRTAADRLGELDGRTAAEELARADAYEAADRPGLAARALRGALAAGAADGPEPRLRLARLLFDARDYAPARNAYQHVAPMLEDRELRAEAELNAARSLFRSGGASGRSNAMTEFRQIADAHSGTAAAGTALFLIGDEANTNQSGLAFYRRAAAVTHSPDAREALYRVGDRSLRLDDTTGAIRAWEDYVSRFPQGEQTARVAYETGKLHLAAGRRAQAETLFRASMQAEPTSYWALRAGERIGEHPLDRVLAEPSPWVGLASDPAEAAAVLRRMDRLAELGMDDARGAEYQAALRLFADRPLARLVLAEGMRDRGEPVEAVRLGRQLAGERGGQWDDRLLRVVYLFPYRQIITDEANRAGVDPMLYAGLVRQESTFRPAVKSWVGATGLGQIMPATGRWLAPQVGIRDYSHDLLEVPEVNLRMGTKYMADLLRRYNGATDLALAGYNAGPGRADRWRTQFNYGRDTDAFRAAIPFDETRNYVMIVLRNAAIYERLYGAE